jgi:hypothetical protein
MSDIIIAVKTYGTEKRTLPASSQRLTAYKLGAGAEADVLRQIYPNAIDLSTNRTHYHYLHIPDGVTHRDNFVVCVITPEQHWAIEKHLRACPRARVYLWQGHQWLAFPYLGNRDYNANLSGVGPRFNGDIEQDETMPDPSQSDLILTTTSKNGSTWWWIGGNTYPIRNSLSAAGCRWSRKRQQWYYPGDPLPESIHLLVNPPDKTPDEDPCTPAEAEAVLGVQIMPKSESSLVSTPPRRFQLNDKVYARHDLETPAGVLIPTGTEGNVVKLYNHNTTAGWSYDVEFGHIGTGWYFERELSVLETPSGIRITHGRVVPPGFTEPTDVDLKRQLAGTIEPDEEANTEITAHARYQYLLPLPAGRELWGIVWEIPAAPRNLWDQFLAEGLKFQIGNRMWSYTGETLPPSIQLLVTIKTTPLEAIQEAFRNCQPTDDDGTDLCPEWLQNILPYSDVNRPGSTQDDTLVYAHFFTPDGDWHLFIKDQNIDRRSQEESVECFCYAVLNGDLLHAEWGWQSLNFLRAVKGQMGLHMDRDTSFLPKTLKDALAEWKHHRGINLVPVEIDAPEDEPTIALPVGPQPPHFAVQQTVFTNQDTQDLLGQLIITGARGVITQSYGWREEFNDYQYGVNFRLPDEPVDRVVDCLERLLTDQAPPSGTRIIRAPVLTDEVKVIIQQAQTSMVMSPTRNAQTLSRQYPTQRQFIGELTGSISGFVYCYNLALSDHQVLYLEFAGPQTAAEAIRARISMRQGIKLLREDAATLDLEFTKQDDFLTFTHYQPEAHLQHIILVQNIIQTPQRETLLIRTDDQQVKAKLLDLLKKHIDLPILETWIDYLWAAGRAAQLIRKPILYGDLDLFQISLDTTQWGLLIYGGLREHTIAIE